MKIEMERLVDKRGVSHSCFSYDLGEGKKMTSAEYFVVDTKSDAFKEATDRAGGFLANMTTRRFESEGIDPYHMAFVSVPGRFADYRLAFLYLDKDGEVVSTLFSKSAIDYLYFKKKFANCITEEGCSFDLALREGFSDLASQFEDAESLAFSVTVGGTHVGVEDTIEIQDVLHILNEKTRERIKNTGVSKAVLRCDIGMNDFSFVGPVLLENGEEMQEWQFEYGTTDKEALYQQIRIDCKESLSQYCSDEEELEYEVEQSAKEEYNRVLKRGSYTMLVPFNALSVIAKEEFIPMRIVAKESENVVPHLQNYKETLKDESEVDCESEETLDR